MGRSVPKIDPWKKDIGGKGSCLHYGQKRQQKSNYNKYNRMAYNKKKHEDGLGIYMVDIAF